MNNMQRTTFDVSTFAYLRDLVNTQVMEIAEDTAYVVDLPKDVLWDAHLNAFSEAKRQSHNCNTCRQFIKNCGGLVTINEDLSITTVWDSLSAGQGPYVAAQKKYLFPSTKGQITTQDLFDFTLQSLNSIAKSLNASIKDEEEEDFISERSVASTDLRNKLEIVKAVIKFKKDLAADSLARKQKAQERQRLLEILESKQAESLNNLSVEEIEKRLAELA